MCGQKTQAGILAKATKIIFPKTEMVAETKFRALWKLGKYLQAIKVYRKTGRMFFWHHSEAVGRYYERMGQLKEAMREYEYLMNTYLGIRKDFLPLPKGPAELFKLGKWYASRNKVKARKFLELYLSTEERCKGDPALWLRHKKSAQKILHRLDGSKEGGYVV